MTRHVPTQDHRDLTHSELLREYETLRVAFAQLQASYTEHLERYRDDMHAVTKWLARQADSAPPTRPARSAPSKAGMWDQLIAK